MTFAIERITYLDTNVPPIISNQHTWLTQFWLQQILISFRFQKTRDQSDGHG